MINNDKIEAINPMDWEGLCKKIKEGESFSVLLPEEVKLIFSLEEKCKESDYSPPYGIAYRKQSPNFIIDISDKAYITLGIRISYDSKGDLLNVNAANFKGKELPIEKDKTRYDLEVMIQGMAFYEYAYDRLTFFLKEPYEKFVLKMLKENPERECGSVALEIFYGFGLKRKDEGEGK